MNDISVKLLYTDRNPRVQRGRELKVAPRIKGFEEDRSYLFTIVLIVFTGGRLTLPAP